MGTPLYTLDKETVKIEYEIGRVLSNVPSQDKARDNFLLIILKKKTLSILGIIIINFSV